MKTLKPGYIVIKSTTDQFAPYLLIDPDKFTWMAESDTYDRFGQKSSTYDCGDSVILLSPKAAELANIVAAENYAEGGWQEGDIVYAHDHSDIYDDLVERLEKKSQEGDYELYQDKCLAYNYWNGSHYASCIIQREHYEPTHEVIQDEQILSAIEAAFESKTFKKSKFGADIYESEDGYRFDKTFHQGSFAEWKAYTPQLNPDNYSY